MFACHRKRIKYTFCSDECKNTPFIPKKCVECDSVFHVTYHNARSAKFCSTDCRNRLNRKTETHKKGPQITLVCGQCKKEFKARKIYKDKQRYCSRKCSGIAIGKRRKGKNNPKWKEKVKKVCLYCNEEFKTFPSRTKRAKYCCKKHSLLGNLERLSHNPRTNIEIKMAETLKRHKINFTEQVLMFDKFLVDFRLDDYPIIVQCDGKYWHDQPTARSRDKGQDRYLTKSGYVVLRFDDKQILDNINSCIALIKHTMRQPDQPPLMPYV